VIVVAPATGVDPRLLRMTFPAYRHLLELRPARRTLGDPSDPLTRPVAIVAYDGDEPVGLALLDLPLDAEETPQLLSLYVVPEHRRRGIGTRLVGAAEEAAREHPSGRLRAVWSRGMAGAPAVEAILRRRGWPDAVGRSLLVRLTVAEAARLPWLDRVHPRPGCEVVPWCELAPPELEELRRSDAAEEWIAPDLRPWRYTEVPYHEASSVALRTPEGVRGWVINHEVRPGWVRFSCSFIHKRLGRRAQILPLYASSIRRLIEGGAERITFNAPAWHPSMVRFVERRIAPWAGTAAWTVESTLRIPDAGRARAAGGGAPGRRSA